jgi:hypothetical protein
LTELLEVERAKLDAATRDYLVRLNKANISTEEAQKIRDLKKKVGEVKRERDGIRDEMKAEMIRRLNAQQKEFEQRKLEIKRRAIGQAIANSR